MENKTKKMTKDIKIFISVCVLIALAITSVIIFITKPDDVVAVGNSAVTTDEFQYYYNQNIQNILQYKDQGMDEQTFLSSPSPYGNGTILDMVKEQTLQQAVQIEYLLMRAKSDGFKADSKLVNEEWNRMEENLKQSAGSYGLSIRQFTKQAFGVSFNQLKRIYKDNLVSQQYMEQKIDDMLVDEQDLMAFYEENRQAFDYKVVRHILISCDRDAEDDMITEKSNLAQDILNRVNQGEDFSALVEEYSEDYASVETGGVYEVMQNGRMVPEFEEWAFSHGEGDTGIARTDFGFHIMQLDNSYNTLDSQREQIEFTFKSHQFQLDMDESLGNGEYELELKDAFYQF